jgi:2,5-diketo-D-gluconate reductase A
MVLVLFAAYGQPSIAVAPRPLVPVCVASGAGTRPTMGGTMLDPRSTVTLPAGGEMPLLGFGTWRLAGRSAYEAVRRALAVGYRHIDTATMYGNEEEIGRAVRDSGVPRAEIFLTTKLPPGDFGRERATIEASLAALHTDYVDLWLIHWPPPDADTDLVAWQAFQAARDAGLTRAIGVSNYDLDRIDALTTATGEAPAVNQFRCSPSLYDPRLLTGHRTRGVVAEGYSPFRSTDLADPVLVEIAATHGVTPAQVVLRWHLEHGIVVIPKSVDPDRISINSDIFGFSLDPTELARIDGMAG